MKVAGTLTIQLFPYLQRKKKYPEEYFFSLYNQKWDLAVTQ